MHELRNKYAAVDNVPPENFLWPYKKIDENYNLLFLGCYLHPKILVQQPSSSEYKYIALILIELKCWLSSVKDTITILDS